MNVAADQPTVKSLLTRMDDAWAAFRNAVRELPGGAFDQRLGENAWTRKQMLAHISVWHDATTARLQQFQKSGEAIPPNDDEDVTNARAARNAEGRTTGEVLLALDESFRRLRREVARLSDEQVGAFEGWTARIVGGNTFGHYADHAADVSRHPKG